MSNGTQPQNLLLVSMKRKNSTVILKCSACGFETPSRHSLEHHVVEKHFELVGRKSIEKKAKSVSKDRNEAVVVITQEDCRSNRSSNSSFDKSNYTPYACTPITVKPSLNRSNYTPYACTPITVKPNQDARLLNSQPSNPTVFECQLCDYWCENQRTIKAHMWKHSGHKNLQYPSFRMADSKLHVKSNGKSNNGTGKAGGILEKKPGEAGHFYEHFEGDESEPAAKTRRASADVERKASLALPTLKPEVLVSPLPVERSVSEQSAAALLTLLHHGRYDESMTEQLPACQASCSLSQPAQNTSVEVSQVFEPRCEPPKPKSGICSSLLAVIEQLRGEAADGSSPSNHCSKPSHNKPAAGSNDPVPNTAELVSPVSSSIKPESHVEYEVLPGNLKWLPDEIEVCSQPSGYRCKICQHYSGRKSAVLVHLSVAHKRSLWQRGQFPCSLCAYEGKSYDDLQTHTLSHCRSKGFHCHHCQASFKYKSQLRAHTSQLHSLVQIQTGFICSKCETKNPLPRDFDPNSSPFTKCRSCGSPFNPGGFESDTGDSRVVKSVESTGSAEIKSDAKSGVTPLSLVCYQCDFIAINTRSLKSHLKRHENDRRYVTQPLQQYKCNICGYVCHHPPSLKSHMWRHAGDAAFNYSFHDVIDAADGSTTRPASPESKNDISSAANAPLVTLRCCQCGFETRHKDVLDLHMVSHQDIIDNTFSVRPTL